MYSRNVSCSDFGMVTPSVGVRFRARYLRSDGSRVPSCYGVFAPNFKQRHHIVPNPAHPAAREPLAAPPLPMSWMQRLERVLHIDIEHCGVCGGTLRVIVCIETPEVIERLLTRRAVRKADCIHNPHASPLSAPAAELPVSPSLNVS